MSGPITAESAVRAIFAASGLRLVTGHLVVPMPLVVEAIRPAFAGVDLVKSFDIAAHEGFADLSLVLSLLGNPLNLDAQLAIARAKVNGTEAQLVLSLVAPPSVGVNGMPIHSQFVRVLDMLGQAALQTVPADTFTDLINQDQAQNGRLLKVDFAHIDAVEQALNRRIGGVRVRDLFEISRGTVTHAGIVLRFSIHWGNLFLALFGLIAEVLHLKKKT